jgi:hypothetical protein
VDNAFRRGFKAQAERLALEVRAELGLGSREPLDPMALADHLGIPVVGLMDLGGAREESIGHLIHVAPEDFSAMTVFFGPARVIVYNPAHSAARRSNSLTHELSHVLLEHEPDRVFSIGGCRRWSAEDEAEADWLSGVLLVPRQAALSVARAGTPVFVAAIHFGVSADLRTWRLNHTGARKQAERERMLRRRGRTAG